MLRNRFRAVTRNQAAMADHSTVSSPTQNQPKPILSFFGSPRVFNGFFLSKNFLEIETTSPTSILDTKPFSSASGKTQPFGFEKSLSNQVPRLPPAVNKHSWEEESDFKGIGLVLIDSITGKKTDEINFLKAGSRMVLVGSNLKIQIPLLPSSSIQSPKSPTDFGIKTRNSQALSPMSVNSPQVLSGHLSLREMELSEDYTCVISHGPIPKTTHIYDNCIVESCCGAVGLFELKKEHCHLLEKPKSSSSESFLSFCYTCKKDLGQGKDIYIYGGEKAFCSRECRCQQMLFDGVENPELG